ncbi:MAG: flagellar biosynthesis protein FlhF [Synergistaceae bacterium]|jgi:flagellar biosynthesis protein FlhF|nr:flagellar biosynthesis protein FlhF [Synergistaceae bacterium]
MRVINQITFEAKDDAEALRLAGERLGKDAVILSTRIVGVGGIMGMFKKNVLLVTAGILEDDYPIKSRDKEDDSATKERLLAFQRMLDIKQAAEMRNSTGESPGDAGQREPSPRLTSTPTPASAANGVRPAKVIYSSGPHKGASPGQAAPDVVSISSEGMAAGTRALPPTAQYSTEAAQIRDEVADLARRVDSVLGRTSFTASGPAVPAFSAAAVSVGSAGSGLEGDEIYKALLAEDVEPEYARELVSGYRAVSAAVGSADYKSGFEGWLAPRIRCAAKDVTGALGGRKVMLLGPTGAGKTTTVAKLAAIQALWEHRNVLLLTSDTYRIAAADQLRTYAKILGVPIEVVFEVDGLRNILDRHGQADLILMDTAGHGQNDRKNANDWDALCRVFRPDAVHLVLPANMKYRDMRSFIDRMSGAPISHVIFTKLDETVSCGAIFNAAKSLDRPVSFMTAGQNVPNDLEVASGAAFAAMLARDGNVRPIDRRSRAGSGEEVTT